MTHTVLVAVPGGTFDDGYDLAGDDVWEVDWMCSADDHVACRDDTSCIRAHVFVVSMPEVTVP